ncbi:uncharacterized protein BDFB_005881 [Asbolus verrucosus]|uniref:Rho-GAP domain-containing protein n=1 Tax=Asbolus verrucosus TaxID=1661398 RepID=A0A482W720_ASBVE|nr:uncharacterized protein BDFB_005881 [Asbolus verrucosus]
MTRNTIDFDRLPLSENEIRQLQDLITEFDSQSKDVVDNSNKPGSFPVFEEEKEVQIRPSRSIKSDRPKTYTSPVINKKDDSVDFRGPCNLEIVNCKSLEVTASQTLRLMNSHLQILDESGTNKITTLTMNLKKGTKLISEKVVEMMDANKTVYRFHFTSNKEAKLFIEREKSRPPASKDKSAGSFSIAQLLKLLKKRSSRDLLESKGIIKNEPIFGNTLQELCDSSNPVPEVITRIVELIEEPENITSVGLYRASANLAVVQHIRCEINCGRWEILEKYRKDVDVLAGTLKLFFRELKEPLIPEKTYQELLSAINGEIDKIMDSLPEINKATLLYIIQHLLNVCRHKNENKMDIHNISICWGPSLIMFPDNCSDLVTQTTEFTSITEHLLNYYRINLEKTNVKTPPKRPDFTYQVVQKITNLIQSNVDAEGIYRKSGSNTKIDKIMKQLEMKYLSDLDKSKNDVHELCCVLKKYLGSLKEPLIPNGIFDRYCEISDKSDGQLLIEVRQMIDQIPKKDVLLLLLRHLRSVIQHEKNNKMSMAVMTDIWMTTLANPVVQQNKKKMQKLAKFFQILISADGQVLPDLLPESEPSLKIRESRYENVLDDINDKIDSSDKVDTKL